MTDTPTPAPILAAEQGASCGPGSQAAHDAPAGVDPSRDIAIAFEALENRTFDFDCVEAYHLEPIVEAARARYSELKSAGQSFHQCARTAREEMVRAVIARVSDEHPTGEGAVAAEGRSPASAVAESQTPEQRVSKIFEQFYATQASLSDLIALALRTARNEALEEAAAIARDYDEDHANRAVMRNTASVIFERIRALKEPTP